MAITKILNIQETKEGNPATHLQHALAYIQNPDKTEKCLLVGSINCLPETVFEQMMETKQMFGKTGKRQGYHVIISFPPKEKVTPDQAMSVVECFAQEVLGEDYEAVYAIHTDKEHMHGHLIWNSVSITTGKKYNSPKGNWKNHLQPITNKYCEEVGLSICPAEYSKEPVNMSKDKWEREQNFKEYILRDAKFCAACAGSVEHFVFLMKQLGYEFKSGETMAVRIPGKRCYHEIEKLDEMFAEDNLKYYLDMPWAAKPFYYSKNPSQYYRKSLSPFQKKYYTKMYRMRIVEQKRFFVKSAKYAEDLKKLYIWQDEYLMLVQNDIRDIGGLIDYMLEQKRKEQEIDDRQHKIYKENRKRKRAIKTEDDLTEYQIWHFSIQKELEQLKQEKKEAKYQQKLADMTLHEKLSVTEWDVLDIEPIREDGEIEIPKYEEIIKEEKSVEEQNVVIDRTDKVYDEEEAAEKRREEMYEVDAASQQHESDYSNTFPETIEKYFLLPVVERANLYSVFENMDVNVIFEKVKNAFKEHGYRMEFSEMYDEAEELRKTIKRDMVETKAAEIARRLQSYREYKEVPVSVKVDAFGLEIGGDADNLKLYRSVLDKLEVELEPGEQFEDYQKIYDETVKRYEEKSWGRERGRGR